MNDKKIKAIFEAVLLERGFRKTRYIYVRDFDSFLFRVSLQRSLGSDEYHLDCYFLLKELHEYDTLQSFVIADITGRQKFKVNGEYTEFIKIEDLEPDDAREILVTAIDELLSLVESGGLKGYLEKYPETIETAPSGSKTFLQKKGVINTNE